ncbi:MAG: hypothetical protein DME00_28140 [Candidatus Rokuibacteriota bacterium]|nr:MAG: hypothetical protein DME00_28140 [Candidatus Rokubacteria bacterium]PYO09089.1 MAG: hypothetical protein DMD75_16745 [Candidatus Rokubacteria bacterium]
MFHPHDGRLVEDGIDQRKAEDVRLGPTQDGTEQSGLARAEPGILGGPERASLIIPGHLARH